MKMGSSTGKAAIALQILNQKVQTQIAKNTKSLNIV